DGIRDGHVTGVQTCALPIFSSCRESPVRQRSSQNCCTSGCFWGTGGGQKSCVRLARRCANTRKRNRDSFLCQTSSARSSGRHRRSEERRVGKECRAQRGGEQ